MPAPGAAIDVMAIFNEALEQPSASARAAYLDRACVGDPAIRSRVEILLGAHERAVGFLESPAQSLTIDVDRPTPTEAAGTAIGPYKLMEQIGEGGMGAVYVAEQSQPVRRKVALKIIKPGMDTKQVVARFEAERQALAMMDHPNIARVFDGGVTESGRPYFVMELVRGIPITEYCDREQLSIPERLELFVQVCRAVQHAHQKGIIHRDLKPSNILVTIIDGAAVPKVIDFGVAKATGASLTERTLYTAFQQFIGTPLYMSPEQADLSGVDIDTRSDIYSLGVLLYELLTGTTPFDQDTFKKVAFDELRRIIREQEPPRPSTRLSSLGATRTAVSASRKADARVLDRTIRGELDWIVMKALEKDRRRRYETANDFAADVARYLSDQPVEAGPPSASYRLRKFLRRNKGPVAAGLALAALLVLGTVGTSIGLVRAVQSERKATFAAGRARTAELLAKDRLLEVTREKERATAAEANAKEEAAVASAVKDFLTVDLLAEAAPEKNARNKKVTVEEALGRAAASIADRFAQQPRVEAEIRSTIGETYRSLGDFTAAQPQLERAWQIGRRVLGEEHPDTLVFMNNLAILYQAQGKLTLAEPLLLKVVEAQHRVLGEEDPETLKSMHNLGVLYGEEGKFAQAEQLSIQSLESMRRVLGEEHHYTLGAMTALAFRYADQGKSAEAERLFVQVMEIARRVLGEEHPDTLKSMLNLASLYPGQHQYAKAKSLQTQVLETSRRVLGEEHPFTLSCSNNLANTYRDLGKLAEAEALLVRTVATGRRVLGDEHPLTLRFTHNLGKLYLVQGRYADAEPLLLSSYEATSARDQSIPSRVERNLVPALKEIVQLYEGWGEPEKAAEWRAKLPPSAAELPVDVFARP